MWTWEMAVKSDACLFLCDQVEKSSSGCQRSAAAGGHAEEEVAGETAQQWGCASWWLEWTCCWVGELHVCSVYPSLVSLCTDVGMARLRSTLSTAARRSPMLLAGSVSGRPHSKWWWRHDIGFPLLAAYHSPCKAPWSGMPCWTTSTHSRIMSPLNSAWKPGFSLATSVLSALETVWQLRYINSHLLYHTVPSSIHFKN